MNSLLIFILFSVLSVRIRSQNCHGISQYDQCSSNTACTCLHQAGTPDSDICTHPFVDCSELVACIHSQNLCFEPNHLCVHHPLCNSQLVCYPVPSFNRYLCPPMAITNITITTTTVTTTTATTVTTTTTTIATTTTTTTTTTTATTTTSHQQLVIPNIPANAQWTQNGVTVAGGNGQGSATNQLNLPQGFFVHDDQTMLIADHRNHRIVQWEAGATTGTVVAGGNGQGNRLDQLSYPTDVLIEKETNSLIICDWGNRRIVRWSRRNITTQGVMLIDKIECWGLIMDDQGNLHVSNIEKHEVQRYQMDDMKGTLVAGGNGLGTALNQLNEPLYTFVDRQEAVYVSDNNNHRIMKWQKGATEGIVVTKGQGQGNALTQLNYPRGLFIDASGTLYIADHRNHRILRWLQGAQQGNVIAGGKGEGSAANQLNFPTDLSFDLNGNLYVVDYNNHRVQRFSIQ